MNITGKKSGSRYLMATHREMHPNCPICQGIRYSRNSAGADLWRFCHAENRKAHPLLENGDAAASIRIPIQRSDAQSMRGTSTIRMNAEHCIRALKTRITDAEQLHRRHVLFIGGHGGTMPFLWLSGIDVNNDDRRQTPANFLLWLVVLCACAIVGGITIIRWIRGVL